MSFKIEKGSYTNTLDSASLSGNQTITLPNATGTVALTNQLAKVATSGSYNDLSGKPTLAKVATSGSYNDLSNKPSIPSTPKGYITQTWRSGNNWYRVWNDGFIEQGGYSNQTNPVQQFNNGITFSKRFGTTSYTLQVTYTKTTYQYGYVSVNGRRTTGADIFLSMVPGAAWWYAAGY